MIGGLAVEFAFKTCGGVGIKGAAEAGEAGGAAFVTHEIGFVCVGGSGPVPIFGDNEDSAFGRGLANDSLAANVKAAAEGCEFAHGLDEVEAFCLFGKKANRGGAAKLQHLVQVGGFNRVFDSLGSVADALAEFGVVLRIGAFLAEKLGQVAVYSVGAAVGGAEGFPLQTRSGGAGFLKTGKGGEAEAHPGAEAGPLRDAPHAAVRAADRDVNYMGVSVQRPIDRGGGWHGAGGAIPNGGGGFRGAKLGCAKPWGRVAGKIAVAEEFAETPIERLGALVEFGKVGVGPVAGTARDGGHTGEGLALEEISQSALNGGAAAGGNGGEKVESLNVGQFYGKFGLA